MPPRQPNDWHGVPVHTDERMKPDAVHIVPPPCGAQDPYTSGRCYLPAGHDGQHYAERSMPVAEVRERLDRLREHGFIEGWREEHRRFWVDHPGAYRWYTRSQIGAFVDGANAMGAAP